ncbi:MAG: CsgG/HfaB family protein [Trueperaceae bacterium]|nr:CsgG/HfaB family protein [Trueperaceae bacterium]
MNRALPLALVLSLSLLAACAPTTEAEVDLSSLECQSDEPPRVAVIEFENTTGRHGTTVTGVEEAATARLITLMKESDCYVILERSELQNVMAQQGLESMEPEALAEAAGAGYVVTGTVTRATIAEPGVTAFGLSLGETRAQVEVDVRATDIITGEVVVSLTGIGTASDPNIAVNRIPAGRISYNDPTVGPLLADASAQAVREVVAAIRTTF